MSWVTLHDLVAKYGSEGRAAGAIALGLEPVHADFYYQWPEAFRMLVLYKQNLAVLKLAALAAGTSLARLHAEWHKQESTNE